MKSTRRVLSLVLAMLMLFSMFTVAGSAANVDVAQTSAAVTSDGTARLYFNMTAVSWWSAGSSGDGNFAYFMDSSKSGYAWSAHSVKYSGNTYYVVIPEGTWSYVILTRNNTSTSPSWSNKWNQTGDISLSSSSNYMSKFSEGSTSATWGTAVKPASTAAVTASLDTVEVGGTVELSAALSSNADINTVASVEYSAVNGTVADGVYTAQTAGADTVTATVTYYPNGYSSLTSTATATVDITVTEPAVEETEAPEASGDQPATEPEATEPEATEPEATEPEATEPEATEPEATEPEVEPTEEETEAPLPPIAMTVYCINSAKWDAVCAHAWNDSGDTTTWPGIAMTKTEDTVNGFDVYKVTFEGYLYSNIIFNNNNNGSQTETLTFIEDNYYDIKANTWYESLDEVPAVDPLTTDRYIAGSFNGWSTVANEFKLNAEGETTGYLTLTLDAETTYEFKVVREGTWTSCATPITDTVEGLTFSSSVSGNATITTTVAGDYVFSFGLNSSQLSVTYPEAPTEPEATEPEATEPEATEPEATEPEATEPEATEPVEVEYMTIYFQNNWMWSDINYYYWGSAGENPAWPGYAMEYYGNDGTYDIYMAKVPTDITGLIINGTKDDGSGAVDQTPNITEGFYDGICYYMTWSDGNQVGYEDITVILPSEGETVEPTEPEASGDQPATEPEIEKITKVDGVKADSTTTNSITVSWDAAEGVAYYWVFVDGVCYNKTTETTMTIAGRDAYTEYEVYVLASYADKTITLAADADVVKVKTKGYSCTTSYYTDASSITVNWAAEGCTKAWIYYGTDPSNLSLYASSTGEAFVITGLDSNTAYYYHVVCSFDGVEVSSYIAQVYTLVEEELVADVAVADGNLVVDWEAIEGGYKYWVFVETAEKTLIYCTQDATEFTLEGFAQDCTVTVKAAVEIDGVQSMTEYYSVSVTA